MPLAELILCLFAILASRPPRFITLILAGEDTANFAKEFNQLSGRELPTTRLVPKEVADLKRQLVSTVHPWRQLWVRNH